MLFWMRIGQKSREKLTHLNLIRESIEEQKMLLNILW